MYVQWKIISMCADWKLAERKPIISAALRKVFKRQRDLKSKKIISYSHPIITG